MFKITKEQANQLVISGYTGSIMSDVDGFYATDIPSANDLEEKILFHEKSANYHSRQSKQISKILKNYNPIEEIMQRLGVKQDERTGI